MRIISLTFATLLLWSSTLPAQENQPQFNIYVTSEVVDNQPTMKTMDAFDCNDRIYLVLEALKLPEKEHEITVRWINPAGEQEEKTDYRFPWQPFVRVWAWLQLSGPTGAVLGQVFDPAFGMEEFIGSWTAKVAIDRESIRNINFDVIC